MDSELKLAGNSSVKTYGRSNFRKKLTSVGIGAILLPLVVYATQKAGSEVLDVGSNLVNMADDYATYLDEKLSPENLFEKNRKINSLTNDSNQTQNPITGLDIESRSFDFCDEGMTNYNFRDAKISYLNKDYDMIDSTFSFNGEDTDIVCTPSISNAEEQSRFIDIINFENDKLDSRLDSLDKRLSSAKQRSMNLNNKLSSGVDGAYNICVSKPHRVENGVIVSPFGTGGLENDLNKIYLQYSLNVSVNDRICLLSDNWKSEFTELNKASYNSQIVDKTKFDTVNSDINLLEKYLERF
jgi:hypothetical protein